MNFSKYHNIGQFRNVVKNISEKYEYYLDEKTGIASYNKDLIKSTLTFEGTVKVHGSNAGIYCENIKGVLNINAQKRSSSVSKQGGHFGFADNYYGDTTGDYITAL